MKCFDTQNFTQQAIKYITVVYEGAKKWGAHRLVTTKNVLF